MKSNNVNILFTIITWSFYLLIFYFTVLNMLLEITTGFHVVHQYEKGVVFRLGKYHGTEEPGLNFVWPMLDSVIMVESWDRVVDIPKQDVVTKDLVTLSVDGVIRYKVIDHKAAIVDIDNFQNATVEFALATLKEAVGEVTYETLVSKRSEVNDKIKLIVEEKAATWGVKVKDIEIKNLVALNSKIQEALTKKAIAEQERAARLISSKTEIEVAGNLMRAAKKFGNSQKYAFELRRLRALEKFSDMKSGNLFLPLDMLISSHGGKEIKK